MKIFENKIAIFRAHDEGLRKYSELMKLNGGPKDRHEAEILDNVQAERAKRRLIKYLDGKPLRVKKKKKALKEEAPANAMGGSSSMQGAGAIATYDPMLKFKSYLKRKKKDGSKKV